jgi:hypothetical protein
MSDLMLDCIAQSPEQENPTLIARVPGPLLPLAMTSVGTPASQRLTRSPDAEGGIW